MSEFTKLLLEPEILIELEPEELGLYLLEYINNHKDQNKPSTVSYYHYTHSLVQDLKVSTPVKREYQENVSRAISEAWLWLEREGFLVPEPDSTDRNREYVSKRGKRITNHESMNAYKKTNMLPRLLLHPVIDAKI